MGVTAFTQFIGWAPIQGMPDWLGKLLPSSMRNSAALKNFGMPTGLDEQYTWMALATIFGFVMIAWDMMVARQAALAPAKASSQEKLAEKEEKKPEEVSDGESSETKSEQPVWRERLDRRMHGGKRRRRR